MSEQASREPILIVDDTPVNLKLIRILLESQGYEVRTANDAEEALEVLKEFKPALLLLDVQLPGMDGLELTQLLRQNPATRNLIIVAVTASAMKGDEQKALEAGFDGYITKPIDTRTLPVKVREYLRELRPQRDSDAKPPVLELGDLRRRFLEEGLNETRRMLAEIETNFDCFRARRVLHQWVGVSSLLSHRDILERVRDLQHLLDNPQPENGSVIRERLSSLAREFEKRLAEEPA